MRLLTLSIKTGWEVGVTSRLAWLVPFLNLPAPVQQKEPPTVSCLPAWDTSPYVPCGRFNWRNSFDVLFCEVEKPIRN